MARGATSPLPKPRRERVRTRQGCRLWPVRARPADRRRVCQRRRPVTSPATDCRTPWCWSTSTRAAR